ncbi:response regulator [Flavobacteriales bacterium]|nr:response regulator [Flavobacteriales bacterium]
MNILIIEDNKDVRENTSELLELAGYSVAEAENGKIGVKKAKELLPDLIICDIMMPEMDGYDVLYYLSIDPKTSCIPFIFLTAKSDAQDFRKGMELGADDYLTKPFEEIDLLKAIERRINKSKLIKDSFSNPNSTDSNGDFKLNNVDEKHELFKNKKKKLIRAKNFIYLQYGSPIYLYYIKKGQVKTFKTNEDGKEFITGLYKENEFFGYHSLLKDDEYSDSAIAVKETEVDLIPREEFNNLIKNKREVANEFIRMLSKEVIDKEKELLNLAYNSVKKRVADGLIKYFDKYSQEYTKGLQIPREDLANIAGTSTESVIRTLSEFKKDSLISTEGKTIYITNYDELNSYKY